MFEKDKNSKQKKGFALNVQWKITLVGLLVVAIFVGFIFGYILPQMEKSLYAEKRVEIQQQVQSVVSIAQHYYNLEKEGDLTTAEAQKQAAAAIDSLRYGDDNGGYFFVLDYKPTVLVQPVSKQLVGTDASALKDSAGRQFAVEQVKIARASREGGFCSYEWQYKNDANRQVEKLSFVKAFEPWEWVIGTGVYTVDVQETVAATRTQVSIIALIIMLISLGILFAVTRIMISKPLADIVPIAKAVALGDVNHEIKAGRNDEIGQVSEAFSDIVDYMKGMARESEKLSRGDLDVDLAPKSDKDVLYHAFGQVVSSLKEVTSDMRKVYQVQATGDFECIMTPEKYQGVYKEVSEIFNSAVNTPTAAILKILGLLSEYAEGDFSQVLEKLPGKQVLANEKMDMLRNNLLGIIAEVDMLTRTAAEGKLDVRGDSQKFKGDYLKVITGFNNTLDNILNPLNEVQGALAAQSVNDLTVYVDGVYKGELDKLKMAINKSTDVRTGVVVKLKQITSELLDASKQLTAASEQAGQATQQIASSSQQVAKGAADQASALQETLKAVEQLSRAIDQIAKGAQEQAQMIEKNVQVVSQISTAITQVTGSAQQASISARETSESAQKGAEMSRETVKGMENIKRTMDAASVKVNGLGERSKEIGKIVAAIDDIADQTNLLALNAAVEAARAGEQGRGFAVVADEVRKLAERSQEATKEIADLISGIQSGVADTVTAMDKGVQEVDSGYELANKAGQSLEDILKRAKDMGTQVEQISSAAEELTAMSTEMVKLSDNISAIVEENTAATEEMAATAKQVSKSVEEVAGVAEENSAATEEVSAAAEEISAQMQQVVASGSVLGRMATDFDKLTETYKLRVNGNGNGAGSKEAVGVAGRISNN